MPQLQIYDWAPQLIWLAISFIALYVIMARVALPRISTVLEERRDRIASDLDAAEQLKKDTEEAIAAYEQALAEARNRAHMIAQETRDRLNAEVEAQRAEVEGRIATRTAEAEARIQKAKADAMTNVSDIAAETTEAIVNKLLGGKVTRTEVKTAVGKALAS